MVGKKTTPPPPPPRPPFPSSVLNVDHLSASPQWRQRHNTLDCLGCCYLVAGTTLVAALVVVDDFLCRRRRPLLFVGML